MLWDALLLPKLPHHCSATLHASTNVTQSWSQAVHDRASQARALFVVGGNPGVVYCEAVPTILHVFAANIQAATAWVCGGSLLAQSALPTDQQLVDMFSILCIAPIVPLVLLVSRLITDYRLG